MITNKIEEMTEELIFVGYTNGSQVLYASSDKHGGEGVFYNSTDGGCYIPLYMLKAHAHRIEATSIYGVTLDQISNAKAESESP